MLAVAVVARAGAVCKSTVVHCNLRICFGRLNFLERVWNVNGVKCCSGSASRVVQLEQLCTLPQSHGRQAACMAAGLSWHLCSTPMRALGKQDSTLICIVC